MTVSSPVAADVPGIFDLVVQDGSGTNGYVLVKDDATGLFYRPRRASYGTTPTFLERTNVQGDYGDDQQSFWMTFSQKDWSLGEQQRFFRSNDPDKVRRYWRSTYVDVRTAGQVSMRQATASVTPGLVPIQAAVAGSGAIGINGSSAYLFDLNGHMWEIDYSRTITDLGTHGLGTTTSPPIAGVASDGKSIYFTDTSAGTVGVRKWNTATSTFSTFSASAADALVFNNNTLYGLRATQCDLVLWDSGGTRSTRFTWKGADGSARANTHGSSDSVWARMAAFGGKILILFADGPNGAELWLYDGSAPALIAVFPEWFYTFDLAVVNGVVYISGVASKQPVGSSSSNVGRPTIFYYASGNIGLLWQADGYSTQNFTAPANSQAPALAAFEGGLMFSDDNRTALMYYNPATGGISTVGSYTSKGAINSYSRIVSTRNFAVYAQNHKTVYVTPDYSATATAATIQTSLFDGESSLDKYFKAVKVDFDAASDGNGGSVDVAYQLNSVDGAYTNVQTGATAGTEYTIGQTGRSISIQVTLNKGTSTSGPVLKRIYVRAVPKLQQFRKNEYILELSGQDGKVPAKLRNGQLHNVDGMTMAQNLRTSIASTTPITVTDRFGTYTGIIEPDNSSIIEIRPEIFQAHLVIREI